MKINIPELLEKSKSRKVNKYVKAMLEAKTLKTALDVSLHEATALRGGLTGGQMAEAERIMRGGGAQ